jgi:hypothetical protein
MENPLYALFWILTWLLFLLAQSLFINGIFISAYGKTEKHPDGSDDDSEMILYPFYKLLHKTHIMRRYFAREMLDVSTVPKMDGLVVVWDDYQKDGLIERGFRVIGTASTYPLEKWIKEFYGGKMKYDQINHRVAFYKESHEYVLPSYLRKPTLGCIVCMSSFWSVFTFVAPVGYFYGWNWETTFLWVADIVSLAYVNYLIFKSRPA